MNRLVFFAKCFYVNAAMKMSGPALTKVTGKEYGNIKRIAKIILWVSRGVNYYFFFALLQIADIPTGVYKILVSFQHLIMSSVIFIKY